MASAARGRIIAFRADRLGARLSSLMNAMRLAQALDVEFACAWTETTGVGDVFNDPTELFDADFVARHFLTAEEWRRARPEAEVLRPAQNNGEEDVRRILDSGQDMIVGTAFGVISLKAEDTVAATDACRAQLQRIPFSAPVAAAMRAADAGLAGHTAYHIRRGDLTDDLKAMNKAWPHKMVPNEFYEIHMQERLATTGGVVLFSDDAETVSHYSGAFPSIKTVADVIDSSALTEAQRDLVELYAMARCETIIAPERSAFSSTAADLFGATKQSIADALGPDLTERAYVALMSRLQERPDSFAGDGDIGQSLAHLGIWLERQERWQDAAVLFSDQIQRGMNISFAYPQAMTYQLRNDDPQGALATAAAMQPRHVVHSKDYVDAKILEGYAHIRAGDRARGLTCMVSGFWHGPTGGLARSVVPTMVELGWLNHRNFLPISVLQRTIGLRRGPVKALSRDLPRIDEMDGVTLPAKIGRLETVIWDWAPMLQSVSVAAAARTGDIDAILSNLDTAETDGSDLLVELASQRAVLTAFLGDTEGALSALTQLSEAHPQHWHIWQRISHIHWMQRNTAPALVAAERAVQALPDAPALHAWLGMIQMRARKREAAVESLRIAHEASTGMAAFSSFYAQALRLNRDPDTALKAAHAARALTPMDVRAAVLEAELLEEAGQPEQAAAELLILVDREGATARVFLLLVRLLQEMGAAEQALEVASIASRRFPKHAGIVALGAELAA